MAYSGVLFDFDGVLGDTGASHRWAWKKAFESLFDREFTGISPEQLTGPSSLEIARGLTLSVHQPEKSEKLADLKLKYILETPQGSETPERPVPRFFPGVGEIFDWLSRGGIPFAVVSNAPRDFILQMFLASGMAMPLLVSGTEGLSPKPSPEPYLKAAELLDIPRSQFSQLLVLEDSLPGLASAHSAGMVPLGVSTSLTRECLFQAGAVAVLESIRELPTFWCQ